METIVILSWFFYFVSGAMVGYSLLRYKYSRDRIELFLKASSVIIYTLSLESLIAPGYAQAAVILSGTCVYLVGILLSPVYDHISTLRLAAEEALAREHKMAWTAQVKREVRNVRHERVVLGDGCPSPDCRETHSNENAFVFLLATFAVDLGLVRISMTEAEREKILRRMWEKMLDFYTSHEIGHVSISRACKDPYVLVALAHVMLAPPDRQEAAIAASVKWMCSGSHNTRNLSHADAESLLRGLLDGTLIPAAAPWPHGPEDYCEGCPACC